MRLFWLIAGILLVLFVLFCRTRLGVRVVFGGETAAADVTAGPFRFRVAPAGPKAEKAKKPPRKPRAKKKPKDLTAAAKRIPKPTWAEVKDAYRTLAPACKKALRRTRRGIRIHPLDLSVTVAGSEDPAAAAELYGELHMGVWTAMPALEQLLDIPDPHIHVGIDFDAEKTRAEGTLGISIRIGTLMAAGLAMGIPALKWLLRFRRRHTQPPAAPEAEDAPTAAA